MWAVGVAVSIKRKHNLHMIYRKLLPEFVVANYDIIIAEISAFKQTETTLSLNILYRAGQDWLQLNS